jgi:hypothetical protein
MEHQLSINHLLSRIMNTESFGQCHQLIVNVSAASLSKNYIDDIATTF